MKKLTLLILFIALSCTTQTRNGNRDIASWNGCFEDMNNLVYRAYHGNNFGSRNLHLATDLNDLKRMYGTESYFNIHSRMSNEEILENNAALRELLNNEADPEDLPNKSLAGSSNLKRAERSQAKTIYDDMRNSPCVSNSGPYQRADVRVGFCFGRAIIAHMFAILRGFDPRSMKKIWVVGPMGVWGHHVAFMVRGKDGTWWVIDNVTGLVTHEQWMDRMVSNYKVTDRELMFFTSEASRFGPRFNYTYNSVNLFNVRNGNYDDFDYGSDYYKGFFRDFFAYFDQLDPIIPFNE